MSESYTSEIQQKRFDKELKLLESLVGVRTISRSTPFGIIVRVAYGKEILNGQEIHFDLYMEGKFPFQAPKLLCESVISFPSVSDGRDLLAEILRQKWTPSITSAEIIGLIPTFYTNQLVPIQKDLQNKDFGKFHLGNPYYLETWDRKEAMASYYCTENDMKNQNFTKERVIVITHTAILILELNQQHPGIGYLLSWATLQSLNTIKRSRSDPERVTFEWKQIGDSPPFAQQFKIPQSNELIDLLSRNMQRIGAIVKRPGGISVFSEDEVTGKNIKNMNIHEILAAIEVYEDNFENTINMQMVNSLLELYQQAIEYFAAVSNPQYDIFLQRMHMLLANENVLNLLQGKPVVNDETREIRSEKVQIVEEKKNEFKVKGEIEKGIIIEEEKIEVIEEEKNEVKMVEEKEKNEVKVIEEKEKVIEEKVIEEKNEVKVIEDENKSEVKVIEEEKKIEVSKGEEEKNEIDLAKEVKSEGEIIEDEKSEREPGLEQESENKEKSENRELESQGKIEAVEIEDKNVTEIKESENKVEVKEEIKDEKPEDHKVPAPSHLFEI